MYVVIPSLPTSPYRAESIASARTEGADAVFVVLDGDGGESLADEVIEAPAGRGFASLANRGVDAAFRAGAEHVLLLNDDAVLQEGSLQALRVARPSADAFSPVVYGWDGGAVQHAGLAVNRRTARVRLRSHPPARAIQSVPALAGTACVFSRSAWARVGPFDERYLFYLEDAQWSLRASALGLRLAVVRDAAVRHRGGASRAPGSDEAAFHLARSHALLAADLAGSASGRLVRSVAAASFGLVWVARSGSPSRAAPFLRGFAAGWHAAASR